MTFNIDRVFARLTQIAVAVMQGLGLNVQMPELQPDAFPFWDSAMMVLSIVAMILMTRKYVENWLLWVVIDVISVAIFAYRGVRDGAGVCHSDADRPEWLPGCGSRAPGATVPTRSRLHRSNSRGRRGGALLA